MNLLNTKLFLLTLLFLTTFSQANFKNSSHKIKTVTIDKVEVEYETYGEGIPIIMIHGFGIDREILKGCMEPILQKSTEFKRIYFDLPGMGKTKVPKNYSCSDDMLEFICQFIKQVIGDQKFIVVGNSYGGYLSRGVVIKQLEKINGLLLICPLATPERDKRILPKQNIVHRDTSFYNSIDVKDKQLMDILFTVQNKYCYDRFKSEIYPSTTIADESFLSLLSQNDNYRFSFDLNNTASFNNPALILTGRQDHIVGYKDIWSYMNFLPRGTFVTLDMANHNLQIEQVELFNILVSDFFNRVKLFTK